MKMTAEQLVKELSENPPMDKEQKRIVKAIRSSNREALYVYEAGQECWNLILSLDNKVSAGGVSQQELIDILDSFIESCAEFEGLFRR